MKFPLFLARRFVAGEHLQDALRVAREFKAKAIFVTLDHLGEDVTNRQKARRATAVYLHILDVLHRERSQADISIKLSQIGLALDKKLALQHAMQIVQRGKRYGVMVEIDMESSRYTDDTLDIFFRLMKKHKNTMVALQAYLHRSMDDAVQIVKRRGAIRLVKGGYKEPPTLAFKKKEDTNKNYRKIMKLFLKKGRFLAIATHDEKIVREAQSFIKKNKISTKKYMFQMLYGIRRDLQEELAREGYHVRVYVPYGTEWFPYYWRRIRERKENFFFVLRHLFRR